GGQTHCLVYDARVEIDIGVKAARDEVVVFQRHALQLQGDVQQWVALCDFEHLVSDLFHQSRTRIVIFIDTMPKTHEAEFALFHALDIPWDILYIANFGEHTYDSFVGSTMPGPVEGGGGAGNGAVGIGKRAADSAHGCCARVLFVVSV